MTKEKEFISIRRKSFHYINHGITKGIKGMTTMAWEEMAMVKTEQTCFERDSQIVIVILLQKAFLQKNVLFCKNKQINAVVIFYKVVVNLFFSVQFSVIRPCHFLVSFAFKRAFTYMRYAVK